LIYVLTNQDKKQVEARSVIYRGGTENRFPVKLLKTVRREFFVTPSFDEFRPQMVWSLSNAFTTALKGPTPIQRNLLTAKLEKFLQPYAQTRKRE
jgi:hypothetical protein